MLMSSEFLWPKSSIITLWSTTRSTGTSGSMVFGSFFWCAASERIAARSASSGTPVKSCSTTRETTNGISSLRTPFGAQWASWRTCSGVMRRPSQWRSTASSTIRIDTGRRAIWGNSTVSAGSEWKRPVAPEGILKVCRACANGAGVAKGMGSPCSGITADGEMGHLASAVTFCS